jgi:hypothetical protein
LAQFSLSKYARSFVVNTHTSKAGTNATAKSSLTLKLNVLFDLYKTENPKL